jgi:hypothetical protein
MAVAEGLETLAGILDDEAVVREVLALQWNAQMEKPRGVKPRGLRLSVPNQEELMR